MTEQTIKTNKQKVRVNDDNAAQEIDLTRLFGLLLDKKWLIVVVTTAFTLIGIGYALLATPIYKADALIQIEESSGGLPGVADLESMLGGGEQNPETEMALLKSRKVLSYAVDKLNLEVTVTPKHLGSLGGYYARHHTNNTKFNTPVIASLFDNSYAWGGEKIKVANFTVAPQYLNNTFELVNSGNNNYTLYLDQQQILTGQVNQLAKTKNNDIELLITSLKSATGTGFLLKRDYREDVIADLQKTLSVSGQGKDTGILNATFEGANKQLVQNTLAVITQGFLLQNVQRMSAELQNSIDFLEKELPKIKGDLDAAEVALNQYRLANESVDLSLETQSILEQVVALETRIHDLSFKEAEIAQRFTKEHPSYVSLIKKKQELLNQKQQLTVSVKNLPETQQQVLRLARDVEVNQQIYIALLNTKQELRVARAGTVGNIHIVDTAVVGRAPIKPKKALIVVMSTLLGGMFSVAFVLVRAALNRGVTNPQDFEDVGLTVYATIPDCETQNKFVRKLKLKSQIKKKSGRKKKISQEVLVAQENPSDLAVEAIRSLRTSLHFAMLEAKNNIIMITSASPGVGKSFVSSNLATVLAQAGKKVLLVDADMRKGYLHKMFTKKSDNGLSEYLVGNIELDTAIEQTDVEKLDFISRGKVPSTPSELLMGKRFTDLINTISNDYDLVIIDTPPILAVTDPAIIGHHVGTTLMLARFNQSNLKEIAVAANRFELNGIEIKGVIFNAVKKKSSSYGYYNYEYK
ncbi:polysaccharide biosynthesis tyrosine autokinase [Colwellia sp. C1TZA3]|uniref:polysaccharide biosynthesis tyrosine autokinase n=1 Tax=Colwellia sp. C1TZA3 TaxID=2508879 RepID=UPI0011B966C9|nr:polysaccharide biosynthesis tyrosine autokinase [Colwellia sp. C1TZA3]TWX72949.1 polysaccharide biosynthesis tyrosine autokinase [Colwellia sp. C1TZA3]